MKRIVSISLGSSQRDHSARQCWAGEVFHIQRIGTNGDLQQAKRLLKQYDGYADALGLGGMDLYLYVGRQRYVFREVAELASVVRHTPVVDGSGIKRTLERNLLQVLERLYGFEVAGKSVLLVCALDRFGLTAAFEEAGCRMLYGDLMFGLGLPLPIYNPQTFSRLATIAAPLVTRLPLRWFYPVGKQQEVWCSRFAKYFSRADIIAGDFHYIRRHMPLGLMNKIVITNTVTVEDVRFLAERGVDTLVTSTPVMGGRSLGTNVLEAMLVAAAGKWPAELTDEDYERMSAQMGFVPRIQELGRRAVVVDTKTTAAESRRSTME